MPTINAGSIRQNIFNSISPMPSAVSGALITSVNNAIFFVQNYTGDSIDSNAIPEKYQPAIQNLATATTLRLMAVQDLGVNSVRVGDLSTTNDNLFKTADQFENIAITQLKSLSKSIKFFKSLG